MGGMESPPLFPKHPPWSITGQTGALKGSQLQVCPLRALKKATKVMLQQPSSSERGLT